MREILFRGKRLDNGEWQEGMLLKCTLVVGTAYLIFADSFAMDLLWNVHALDHAMVDPETVGQYIGLRDKSGVRIFEGDILRWEFEDGEPEIAEVTWRDDGHEGVGWYIRSIRPIPGLDILCSGDSEWEVIGNIYDNPELLGGDEDGVS